MPTVYLPQLGETITEATVLRWFKQEGETIERNESLLEVETDKAAVEIPSPGAGVLTEIVAQQGATLRVGAPLAVLGEAAEGTPPAPASTASTGPTPQAETPRAGAGTFISPAVARLAYEHGLDLSLIQGTGHGGRVTKQDVERYLESPTEPSARPPRAPVPQQAAVESQAQAPSQPSSEPEEEATEEAVPVGRMRRSIAEHMVRSKFTAPHAWTMVEVDVTGLVQLRRQARAALREQDLELTHLPFFITAVTQALQRHPLLNASWAEDHILVKRQINLGLAVATDQGLIVPVLHGADRKGVTQLARETQDLIARARQGRLNLDETRGGTFTLNNTGALGSVVSMPIINQPQVAILTTEAIVKRPVILDNDAIAVRSMMHVCISFDHRALDGSMVLQFLADVRRGLESYAPDMEID